MSQSQKTAKDADDVWEDRYFQEQATIAALSVEEARRRAEVLLADPQKFECVAALSNETFDIFAPGLQSLFSRFESIHVLDDEAYLSRQEIELFDWERLSRGLPLWKIGYAHGHSLTLVTPNDERVYDTVDDELGEPFPSVYHWLLWVSAVASNFDLDPASASSVSAPTKPGKRIVSKGRFVVNTGKKAALGIYGTAVCLLGLGAIVVICGSILPLLLHEWLLGLIVIASLGAGCFGLLYLGGKAVKEGKEIDAGVPLTRASAVHLPAAESLVRASQEPIQEQGTVLLRAAGQERETPPEQLLRATQESRKDA